MLKPLGMQASSFTQPPTGERQRLLATGYDKEGKPAPGKYHLYPEQAAAGLWTTATDLVAYVIENQRALEGKSAKVLTQEMTKRRLTSYLNSVAGLGVFINNYYVPVELKQVSQSTDVLQAYVGKYKIADEYRAIELKKDGLWLAINQTTAWRMYSHFFVLEDAAKFSLLLDNAGKVKAIGMDNEPFATRVE